MGTVTIVEKWRIEDRTYVIADYACNVYAAGGEEIVPAQLGLSEIVYVSPVPKNVASARLMFAWDAAAKKLIVSYPTGGGAVPAAIADPSTAVPSGATTMTSSAAQPNLTENAGRGAELAAATDITSLACRLLVIGR